MDVQKSCFGRMMFDVSDHRQSKVDNTGYLQ